MKQTIFAVVIVTAIIFAGDFVVKRFYQPSLPQTVNKLPLKIQQADELSNFTDDEIWENQAMNSPIDSDLILLAEPQEVLYTNSGYSPAEIKIKAGDTVIFKNESSNGMWTASALHSSKAIFAPLGQ